jgi:hypothetical protein
MKDVIQQTRDDMNRLRGRLFQAIEAVGLPERQETAIKGLIRTTTYDAQADLEATLRGTNGNH